MRSLRQNPLWQKARQTRSYQRALGRISGIFLAIALVALFDGLIAQMRVGNNELELLPGESITVSGPAALKNPLASDVRSIFTPKDAPLGFELEGFFTGYWFGSGMWRGKIIAREDAAPGKYELRISFKGASAANAQKYLLTVYGDAHAMRKASLSLLRRFFAINPFWLAACAGIIGVLCGAFTYFFGRRFVASLQTLGLSEIYAHNGAEIWCLAPQSLIPHHSNSRIVLNENGELYCEARVLNWQKGKLHLKLLDQDYAPENGFICLRHPAQD